MFIAISADCQYVQNSINFICQSQERLEAKELTIRSWNSRSQEQEHNDLKNTKQTQNTRNKYNTNVGKKYKKVTRIR